MNAAKQGHLDGACGFYAVTNALSILSPCIPREHVFEAVVEAGLQDGNPMKFIRGTGRGTLKNMLSRVTSLLNANDPSNLFNFTIPYWQTMPSSRKEFFSTFDNVDHKNGLVAIVGYSYKPSVDEEYHHWTVVRKFDGESFTTFDSSGEKLNIPMSSMRVNDMNFSNHATQPYFMNSDDIFLVHNSQIKGA